MDGFKLNKMFGQSSKCLCGHPMEERFHMLLDCTMYSDLREFCVENMVTILINSHPQIITESMIKERTTLAYLILDPSWFRIDIGSPMHGIPNILSLWEAEELERVSRTFCYQIYKRRFDLLSENDEDSETDDDDEYSLHDTSDEDTEDSQDSDFL